MSRLRHADLPAGVHHPQIVPVTLIKLYQCASLGQQPLPGGAGTTVIALQLHIHLLSDAQMHHSCGCLLMPARPCTALLSFLHGMRITRGAFCRSPGHTGSTQPPWSPRTSSCSSG